MATKKKAASEPKAVPDDFAPEPDAKANTTTVGECPKPTSECAASSLPINGRVKVDNGEAPDYALPLLTFEDIQEVDRAEEFLREAYRQSVVPLDAKQIKPPAPGMKGDYLPAGHFWRNMLTIFGHHYSTKVVAYRTHPVTTVTKTRDGKTTEVHYVMSEAHCRVEIHFDGKLLTFREDLGFGVATANSDATIINAIENSVKHAVTDGYKRAARGLALRVGLALQFKGEERDDLDLVDGDSPSTSGAKKGDGPGFSFVDAPADKTQSVDLAKLADQLKAADEAKSAAGVDEVRRAAVDMARDAEKARLAAVADMNVKTPAQQSPIADAMGVKPGTHALAPDAATADLSRVGVASNPDLAPLPQEVQNLLNVLGDGESLEIQKLNDAGLKQWLYAIHGGIPGDKKASEAIKPLWIAAGVEIKVGAVVTYKHMVAFAKAIREKLAAART